MIETPRIRARPAAPVILAAALIAAITMPAFAIDDRADVEPNDVPPAHRAFAWKATLGHYASRDGLTANDVNLRASDDDDTVWVGYYRERGGAFDQWRAGWEHQLKLPHGRLVPSAQLASGGFVGGSVTWVAYPGDDDRIYGLFGLGRTNTRPYFNLNFDPNDSTLFGLGWKPREGVLLSAWQVRDDRLGTGQRVTHAVLVTGLAGVDRFAVDLFRRSGRADPTQPEAAAGNGVALTWDHRGVFVRVARDANWDFAGGTMTRIALGLRL
ncbi:MAG: hypothetical protein WCK28_15795 [Burkholderiales bacterium]|jgi:hypothetical protein